eukprot:IDg2639t1
MEVSGRGNEGLYSSLSSAPLFSVKLVVGGMSGWLLTTFMSADGPHRGSVMWGIIGMSSIISPIMMFLLRDFISPKEEDRKDSAKLPRKRMNNRASFTDVSLLATEDIPLMSSVTSARPPVWKAAATIPIDQDKFSDEIVADVKKEHSRRSCSGGGASSYKVPLMPLLVLIEDRAATKGASADCAVRGAAADTAPRVVRGGRDVVATKRMGGIIGATSRGSLTSSTVCQKAMRCPFITAGAPIGPLRIRECSVIVVVRYAGRMLHGSRQYYGGVDLQKLGDIRRRGAFSAHVRPHPYRRRGFILRNVSGAAHIAYGCAQGGCGRDCLLTWLTVVFTARILT